MNDQLCADLIDIADLIGKSANPEYARVIDAAVDRIRAALPPTAAPTEEKP